MAGNPRIDDLRKRIEKEPGSRLFAQLAEELRKDGELEDAIRVAREGLQKHPNYPSARMTLGRALLDTGDWTAARTEFELVLKSAADNILASRYLGECLESLGDREGAIARYKATLAMAPGEKHVLARLQELEKGTSGAAAPAAAKAATPFASHGSAAHHWPSAGNRPAGSSRGRTTGAPRAAAACLPPPRPPLRRRRRPRPHHLRQSRCRPSKGRWSWRPVGAAGSPPHPPGRPRRRPGRPAPRSRSSRPTRTSSSSGPTKARARASGGARPQVRRHRRRRRPLHESPEDQEFELEAPHEAPSTGWKATIPPLPVVEEPPPGLANWPPVAVTPAPPAAPPAPAAGPSTLTSPTLGELYFNQGFTDKAIEVYRELSAREPGNERLTARLRELEKLQRALGGGEPAPAPAPAAAPTPKAGDDTAAERRQAIERTIVRLEGLLSAIRKG